MKGFLECPYPVELILQVRLIELRNSVLAFEHTLIDIFPGSQSFVVHLLGNGHSVNGLAVIA